MFYSDGLRGGAMTFHGDAEWLVGPGSRGLVRVCGVNGEFHGGKISAHSGFIEFEDPGSG